MSIFSKLIPEAHPNHNVFDLSHRDVFSAKSAMLTTCFVQHTVPNAKYEITSMNHIEVSSMARANFARLKQNIEYYFIPYSQLWRWFETFYYDRVDPVRSPSNELNPVVPQYNLNFSLSDVANQLRSYYLEVHIVSLICQALLEHVEVSSSYNLDSLLHRFLFPGDFSMREFGASMYNEYFDIHGRACVEDMIRQLDNCGYGNFLSIFKYDMNYCLDSMNLTFTDDDSSETTTYSGYSGLQSIIQRIVNAVYDSTGSAADFVDDVYQEFTSIFDNHVYDNQHFSVDFSDFANFFDDSQTFSSPWMNSLNSVSEVSANPYPLLAYLKVFSDNFRSVQYDDTNYSYYYNFDYLTSNTTVPTERIMECLIPRYRLYRRDIVTGTYPNSQFGDVAVATLQNPSTITAAKAFATNQTMSVTPQGEVRNPVDGGGYNFDFNINTGVSALAIRQAEALQRYREKNLRAGNRLKNQQSAFFGDRSMYLGEDYSRFLSASDTQILINSVVATGESTNINLGDKGSIAASSMDDNTFTFESHDWGVIIGVMYILPIAEYEAFGIDPQLTKLEKGDFFHPDLQNLGLSPVYSDVVSFLDPKYGFADDRSVIGFSAHDWEYKTAIDKVHGEFNTLNGVFGDYVTPRQIDLSDTGLLLNHLYCNPSDIDTIFYSASDVFQASDHFKVNIFHKIKAVLPMSVTGLPY